ncbi:hypothetical protein B0J17DRAFT_717660 [Rhizoctonia solani]|nr:hypothetical protein B0J17DRAFT_717660 [Rhizoctonia solani]
MDPGSHSSPPSNAVEPGPQVDVPASIDMIEQGHGLNEPAGPLHIDEQVDGADDTQPQELHVHSAPMDEAPQLLHPHGPSPLKGSLYGVLPSSHQ